MDKTEIGLVNRPHFFNFLDAIPHGPTDFNIGGLLPTDVFGTTPTGIEGVQQFHQTRKSWAIYGEGNLELTDKLTLTAGLRYTKDKFSYTNGFAYFTDETGAIRYVGVSDYQLGGAEAVYLPGVTPGAMPGTLNRYGKSSRISGRAILDYKINDDVMVYASFSRGYRGGTFNGLTYFNPGQVYFVKPESVNAYEAGFKSRFLDNKVQLNVAAFYYDYSGQQGQIVDASATAFLISLDGSMKGLEAELTVAPINGLQFNAGIGILDSSYKHAKSCSNALIAAGNGFQAGNCILAGNGNAVDVGGNPFPYAAKFSANVGLDWDVVETSHGTVKLHTDASYTGKFYYDSFGDYSNTGGAGVGPHAGGAGKYWLVNGRLAYETERYTVGLWGKNLFDKRYYPFGINLESNFALDYRILAEPRTYGVDVTFKF